MENKLQQLTQKLYDEGLEKGRAEADKLVADGVVALVGNGVLSPEEGRAALAKEKEGRWASLAVAPESLSGGAL